MKSRLFWAGGIAAAICGIVGGLTAQTPGRPAFEAASVKPTASGGGLFMMQTQPGGRFVASNVSLQQLVLNAYQLQTFQLTGGPGWISTEHFDITATEDSHAAQSNAIPQGGGLSASQMMMLRALLADRFQLIVHRETRQLPIYALIMTRSDGRLGPKLTRTAGDCVPFSAARGRGSAPPPAGPSPDQRRTCGVHFGPDHLTAGAVTLAQLASVLSTTVNRTVLDKTGSADSFDADLAWTPDGGAQRTPGADEPAIDPSGSSIFTAIQEQLGLKLEPTSGPVDVLVIDHVEKPTAD